MTPASQPVKVWEKPPYRVALALILGAWVLWRAWFWYTHSAAYQETHGDANLARPTVTDCEIARAIVADVHGQGRDRLLLSMFGDAKFSLQTFAFGWEKPTAPPAGYAAPGDDGDWRWCAGLGGYLRSIGWVRLGDVVQQRSAIYVSRPAYNAARNAAVAFQNAMPAPTLVDGLTGRDRRSASEGNLVFLKRDQRTGAWTIVAHGPAG